MKKLILALFLLFPLLAHADAGISSDAIIAMQNSPWLAVAGLGLIILEFMLPTKGVLGLIGVALFVTGTFALAENTNPNLRLSWQSVIIMNILVVGTFLTTLFITWRGYIRENKAITEAVIGQQATVLDWDEKEGRVQLGSAIWKANTTDDKTLIAGDTVYVTGQDNLTLHISTTKGI